MPQDRFSKGALGEPVQMGGYRLSVHRRDKAVTGGLCTGGIRRLRVVCAQVG